MTKKRKDVDAGSRMHILDWLESREFLPRLAELVASTGFTLGPNAHFQPKGRHDGRESVLTGANEPFLSTEQGGALLDWWLDHKHGSKPPTWDFVIQAVAGDGRAALILVEAKAHESELSDAGKEKRRRELPDEQRRTDENHDRIGSAIDEAREALSVVVPKIFISRDASYQFSNRIAYAWKLASMGIPISLVYLGFTGDSAIGGDYFVNAESWESTFREHVSEYFPPSHFGREILCGAASFWLLPRSLPAKRQSPPISERKSVP